MDSTRACIMCLEIRKPIAMLWCLSRNTMTGHLIRFAKMLFAPVLDYLLEIHLPTCGLALILLISLGCFCCLLWCGVTLSGDPLLLIELWIVRITSRMHLLLQARRNGEFQLWFLCPGWVFLPIMLFGGAVCTHINVDVKFVRFTEISSIVLTVKFGFLLESIDAISSLGSCLILNMWFHCSLVLSCTLLHIDINLECTNVLFIVWTDFHNDTF